MLDISYGSARAPDVNACINIAADASMDLVPTMVELDRIPKRTYFRQSRARSVLNITHCALEISTAYVTTV